MNTKILLIAESKKQNKIMNKINLKLLFFSIILLFLSFSCHFSNINKTQLPNAVGLVNDFEQDLTDSEKAELTKIITDFQKETGNQISIVSIANYEPYKSMDEYSLTLFKKWGVGQKDKNNGVMIAFSTALRRIRIQNGYGIESKMTNEETKKIIDNIMLPEFKSENYFEGLKKGLVAIMTEIR